jgi:hypothetical protein
MNKKNAPQKAQIDTKYCVDGWHCRAVEFIKGKRVDLPVVTGAQSG